MRYMGGKSRISRDISIILNTYIHTYIWFVSLFCGTCSVESKINSSKKICNDGHFYLIEMLRAVRGGWIPPETVTKEQYKYIREHKDENPALTGFVGFGCSFGGKWFGGYAQDKSQINYALQSKNSLMRDMAGLNNAVFTNLDYRDVVIPDGSLVYVDPPYNNTTQYGAKFNSDEFWDYMRIISRNNMVFISEEFAPDDFLCVWSKEFRRTLDVNKDNQPIKTERLWIQNGNRDKVE